LLSRSTSYRGNNAPFRCDGQNARPAHGPRRRTDGRLAGPSPRGPAAQGLCPNLTPQSDGARPGLIRLAALACRADGSYMPQLVVIVGHQLAADCGTETRPLISSSRNQPCAYSQTTGPSVVNAGLMISMLRCRKDWTSGASHFVAPCVADHRTLGRQKRSSENT
jgi:hypothetical protein